MSSLFLWCSRCSVFLCYVMWTCVWGKAGVMINYCITDPWLQNMLYSIFSTFFLVDHFIHLLKKNELFMMKLVNVCTLLFYFYLITDNRVTFQRGLVHFCFKFLIWKCLIYKKTVHSKSGCVEGTVWYLFDPLNSRFCKYNSQLEKSIIQNRLLQKS